MGNGLTDPNSWFARYLRFPAPLHGLIVFLFSVVWLFPQGLSLWQTTQQLQQFRLQHSQQQQTLSQQKQILDELQQRFARQELTPQLTQKIAQLNAHISTFSNGVMIHSAQWQFQSSPLLRLQLQSHFSDFQSFFNTLLTQSELEILVLQLSKAEEPEQGSVVAEMLLLLPHQAFSTSAVPISIKEKKA